MAVSLLVCPTEEEAVGYCSLRECLCQTLEHRELVHNFLKPAILLTKTNPWITVAQGCCSDVCHFRGKSRPATCWRLDLSCTLRTGTCTSTVVVTAADANGGWALSPHLFWLWAGGSHVCSEMKIVLLHVISEMTQNTTRGLTSLKWGRFEPWPTLLRPIWCYFAKFVWHTSFQYSWAPLKESRSELP